MSNDLKYLIDSTSVIKEGKKKEGRKRREGRKEEKEER